jgi:amino acid transporter
MWTWFTFWLVLHVLSVVVAFGPTVVFGPLAAYAQKHPQHALAIAEASDMIERRIVIPVAALVPFFGLALIYSGHFDLWKSTWLLVSIGLFIVAFFFAVLVQNRNSVAMVKAIAALPPGPPPEGASGPPPQVAALGKRLQMGGVFLSVMILVILVLMIWRPGSCYTGSVC